MANIPAKSITFPDLGNTYTFVDPDIIGDLSDLETENKDNLVSAINEAAQSGGGGGGSGATSLNELSDVTISRPSSGQVLKYDGSKWANSTDGSDITVDSTLSDTSENPVQNKVIKDALDALKQDTTSLQQVTTTLQQDTTSLKNIHALNTFEDTPSTADYLVIDDGTALKKISAPDVYPTATQTDIETGTSTTPSVVTPKLLHDFMLSIYPVGSIYMSVSSTSPATLFGGTWERIKDTFLLSSGDTYSAGATGGEATHKLTINEMPSHTHSIYYYLSSGNKRFGYNFQNNGEQSSQTTESGGIVNTGGNTAHNNMPPYLAVYVWKRTA